MIARDSDLRSIGVEQPLSVFVCVCVQSLRFPEACEVITGLLEGVHARCSCLRTRWFPMLWKTLAVVRLMRRASHCRVQALFGSSSHIECARNLIDSVQVHAFFHELVLSHVAEMGMFRMFPSNGIEATFGVLGISHCCFFTDDL